MKKIVPFKKDIKFENNIYEIKSISLEHDLGLNENSIRGNFIISGTYKMTEMSVNIDSFNFELPFEININRKYDTKDLKIDINDFYYEVIDNIILSVKIEVSLDNLEEKEISIEEKELPREESEVEQIEEIPSIFDNIEDKENYVSYKIHFVTENDTIESIIEKYETNNTKLEEYNNIEDIKIGDKIIIPYNEQA